MENIIILFSNTYYDHLLHLSVTQTVKGAETGRDLYF